MQMEHNSRCECKTCIILLDRNQGLFSMVNQFAIPGSLRSICVLVAFHLVLNRYLIPSIEYQEPGTRHQEPGIGHLVPGAKQLCPGTMSPDTWQPVLVNWHQVPEAHA